jgi:hypothetical protein
MHRRIFMAAGVAAAGLAAASAPAQAQQLGREEITGPDGRYKLKMPRGYGYLHVAGHGGRPACGSRWGRPHPGAGSRLRPA